MKYSLALIVALVFNTSCFADQLNVVVVLDASGSMDGRFSADRNIEKMDAAKSVLISVVNKLPKDTKLGIVVLPSQGWIYSLELLDKQKAIDAIKVVRANGGTPLGKYMKEGANALIELRKKQKYGVYKLIVITDGESTDDVDTPLIGKYGILSKGILVEAIGVDMGSKHTLATKVPYRNAKNPNELANAVQAVLAESTGGNHSEDYDVIAPLEPQMAMAALEALAFVDDAPVGVKPKFDTDGNMGTSSGVSASGLWITLAIFGIIFICFVAYLLNQK